MKPDTEKDAICNEWKDWMLRQQQRVSEASDQKKEADKRYIQVKAFYGAFDETGSILRSCRMANISPREARHLVKRRKRHASLA